MGDILRPVFGRQENSQTTDIKAGAEIRDMGTARLTKEFKNWLKTEKGQTARQLAAGRDELEIEAKVRDIKAYKHNLGTTEGLIAELKLRPSTPAFAAWLTAAIRVVEERLGLKN